MADAICKPTHWQFKDLEGIRFGRLTVLGYRGLNKHRKSTWLCRCDCGVEKVIVGGNLNSKGSTSCGCFAKEETVKSLTTHGMTSTPEYFAWSQMLTRCRNKKSKAFHRYGGRGIRVCERWLSFECFLSDMGRMLQPGLTLERHDNDGNYEPVNCSWRTWHDQVRNRSTNRYFDYKGRRMCLTDISTECGICFSTIWHRLRRGLTIDKATTK